MLTEKGKKKNIKSSTVNQVIEKMNALMRLVFRALIVINGVPMMPRYEK